MFAALLAQATSSRTTYDLERWQTLSERWHVLALVAVCLAVLVFVAALYRRDSVELRPGMGLVLLALRVIALVGILAYFLELEKRTERVAVHNSRVLVLVDTSLSMGLRDRTNPIQITVTSPGAPSDAGVTAEMTMPNRLEQVAAVLERDGLIRRLRETHDVVLVRFDTETSRLVTLGKLNAEGKVDRGTGDEAPASGEAAAPEEAVDWKAALRPQGVETRLGQALRDLVREERAGPLSGIVVFTDGGQNAGIDAQSAILAARDAKIPIYTVGVGSDRRPAGVRVADFVAPARAYPGDSFVVTGYLQAQEPGRADRGGRARPRGRPRIAAWPSAKIGGDRAGSAGWQHRNRAGEIHAHAGRSRPAYLSAGSQTAARGSNHHRQRPGSRRRNRRPQNQGAAAGQRADARIHLLAKPAPPRPRDYRRRLSPVGPERDFAGRQRDSPVVSQRCRKVVRL